MTDMTTAFAAATWLVWQNDARRMEFETDEYGAYEGLTHLKLQKLLYFAQGIHLALENRPLFPEKIMAWKHGPVVPEVYQKLKIFGRGAVSIEDTPKNVEAVEDISDNEVESLNLAYDNFAIFTAWQLRNMTHEDGAPWDVTVREHGFNAEIPTELIREYFARNVIENA